MEEKISVILVNYNGKAYNDKCISSIFKSTVHDMVTVVVVDNHSTDGSLEELEKNWGNNEQVHIMGLEQNYGFSKANNEGIKWSLQQGFSYLLLLNNDTEIAAETIENMISCQRRTGCIIVPKVLYADTPEIIWCAGGSFTPVIRKAKHRGIGSCDRGQFEKEEPCAFANGCCILLTEKIISAAGLLDERFFLYYEDTEYSMRVKEKGIGIWYCGKAVVYHKVNGATKGNEKPVNAYYITRNWLMCNKMHMKGRFYLFLPYFMLNRLAWSAIWLIQGKWEMVKAVKDGIRDFYGNKTGRYK